MSVMKRLAEALMFGPQTAMGTSKMAIDLVDLATGTTSAQRKSTRVKAPTKCPPVRIQPANDDTAEQLTLWD